MIDTACFLSCTHLIYFIFTAATLWSSVMFLIRLINSLTRLITECLPKFIICVVHRRHWHVMIALVILKAFQCVITCCGSSFLEALCKTTWRSSPWCQSGKETGKFSLSLIVWASRFVIFSQFNSIKLGFRNYILSWIRLEGRQRDHLSVGCVAVSKYWAGFLVSIVCYLFSF